MLQREKAPGWVILWILILNLFFSIIGLLGYFDIFHSILVEFSCEYGGYVSYSYYSFWWILSALPILFYSWIAIASINKRWKRAVTIGTLIIVLCKIINVIIFVFELSASNYYELDSIFKISFATRDFITLISIAGIMLVLWNTRTTMGVKISITVYELLMNFAGYIRPLFESIDINNCLTIVNPLLVLGLFVIYFYNREPKN